MSAGRSGDLIGAEIALSIFLNRQMGELIVKELAAGVAGINHLDVAVRATVSAEAATDAGQIVDEHLAVARIAVNRAGGTTNHADWVQAVHAGIGDHRPP